MVQSKQKPTKGKSELDELKEQNAELQKKLDLLISSVGTSGTTGKENYVDEEEDDDDSGTINISSDAYIKVMSLTPYLLTLTTEEYGRGKKFNFENFGEVKRILYHDLVDIMEQHQNFVTGGYFVILNRDVVRKHGLDNVYKSILTKEKIDKIVVGNDSDAVNLFKSCSDAQKENIAQMLMSKINNNEYVDLNLLDRLSRIIGYNIADRAKEILEVSKLNK